MSRLLGFSNFSGLIMIKSITGLIIAFIFNKAMGQVRGQFNDPIVKLPITRTQLLKLLLNVTSQLL